MRLIDADALKEELELSKHIIPNDLNRLLNSEINRCIEAIDNAPTVETSGDLIKRNLAIAYATSGLVKRIDGENWIRTSEVKQSLNDVPTVEERPQGEWIDYRAYYKCPFCENWILKADGKPKFCDECGADMRGGAE